MHAAPIGPEARRRNVRTALVLASVAVVLFLGILIRYAFFS